MDMIIGESTVIILCGGSWSNGTLIKFKEEFYVCSTAHGIIDTTNFKIKGNIKIYLDPCIKKISLN